MVHNHIFDNFNLIIVLFLTLIMKQKQIIITFQSYYSLISNNKEQKHIGILNNEFQSYYSLISNAPFLEIDEDLKSFQSYYSLISNLLNNHKVILCIRYFNPIIVLFLTRHSGNKIIIFLSFQSYYSLISNLYYHFIHFIIHRISILL